MPRPLSVTLLALAVLCLAAYNALGAYAAIQGYTVLRALPLTLPPAYLIARDVVWVAALAVVSLGLWRQKHWGRLGALVVLTLYVALGWAERLLLAQSDYALTSAPLALVLHLLALGAVWGWLLRPSIRQTFEE